MLSYKKQKKAKQSRENDAGSSLYALEIMNNTNEY